MTAKPKKRGRARGASLARSGCPIVGIGASAGGLEAFTHLLRQLPTDTGLGFVLVQHLDPLHESALTQLLARATAMPVCEVTNNLRVMADHVYIIPPNTSLGIARGVLKLQPRPKNRVAPRSIDFFLEALAKDQRERAIGVILSGSATDGTLGLEAIKAEGGLTFAQDASARYDSMPRSAAAAGCVDFVLSPSEIARELARIAQHPYVAGHAAEPPPRSPVRRRPGAGRAEAPLPARGRTAARIQGQSALARSLGGAPPLPEGYARILLLLRNHCGVDFSFYKSSTVLRRITRRTVLNRRATLEEYADFLQGNAKELEALYADALISVTSFFRNADAFAVLQRRVFPRLLQERSSEPVRFWVLGCSTGQEAYSLAMAFAESAGKHPRARKLQIFATDLSEANLDKARHGLYAKSLAADVSPARLQRFFVEETDGYRVIKTLRESVIFARQNVITDPPFSRLDLISCRNLMIYLEPGLQKKIIPTFHYALKPGAHLFLGAAESVGGFRGLFAPLDQRQKIFVRKAAPAPRFQLPIVRESSLRASLGSSPRPAAKSGSKPSRRAPSGLPDLSAEREADRVTVNQLAPPSVLVNADLQIVQFRGSTGAYLEPPNGKASFDLLKMARAGLMLPLRAALHRAQKENRAVRTRNVRFQQGAGTRKVHLEVIPLKNLPDRCFLVLFDESRRPIPVPEVPPAGRAGRASQAEEFSRVAGLEQDLSEARDYLQSVQERQESANEELQASNEEGQSTNEELQSLNEELETSKEELVSTNEELTTVNEEMTNRNADLHRLNGELGHARTALSEHAARLEILVAGRTAELTATNQQLVASVASTRQGQEKYRELLAQSEVMQHRLRRLTHQIITAQEEERKEISRELHDEVVQTLIGINVELTALGKRAPGGPEAAGAKIAHIQHLVENSVIAVHRFARGLRPAVLDDLGLIPALHAYCKSLAAKQKIKILLTAFGGVEALGEAERTVLFRVAQEALTNVVRHANATEVKLIISAIPDAIRMEIADNGKSFRVGHPSPGKKSRLGLVGMNERVEMVGGTLAIESTRGQGTTVRAEIPFNPGNTKK
jgi:two-component system CheB/CheR fusion protein